MLENKTIIRLAKIWKIIAEKKLHTFCAFLVHIFFVITNDCKHEILLIINKKVMEESKLCFKIHFEKFSTIGY